MKKKNTHMSLAKRVKFAITQKSNLPILQVKKTRQHIYASIFKDGQEIAYSTKVKNFKQDNAIPSVNLRNKLSAKVIGNKIGEMAKQNDINQVVFYRGAHRYHGIIATVADAAREHLKF